MKRTLTTIATESLPVPIRAFVEGAHVYDSSCSPEARVYFIDKDEGYYLKVAEASSLAREAMMTEYFHSLDLGVRVVAYVSDERDYMLTERAKGEDLTHSDYLGEPKKLAELTGRLLRSLHDRKVDNCPVIRTPEYLETVERNYRSGIFDPSFLPVGEVMSADEAYSFVIKHSARLRSNVLIHGDYCLPNTLLDDWKFSKFIDVGNGGMGDRHIDLFWGAWTLNFNLGTDEYRDVFFDAYGRELIDPTLLRVVAVAECFG